MPRWADESRVASDWVAGADLALPDEEPEEPTPSVWVQHLEVERGAIEFTDEARRTPISRSFHAVAFALEDFRTTPEGGDFSFNARSPQDEVFEWKGRFALEPVISSQGEFWIGALNAPGLLDFLGDASVHAHRGQDRPEWFVSRVPGRGDRTWLRPAVDRTEGPEPARA